MKRYLSGAAALTAALALTACAGAEPPPPAVPADTSTLLGTRYAVTVLDDGDGPELCLGGVMESYPPQCGGPKLVGWDWADVDGQYEEASGVKWGVFALTGFYDPAAETFDVESAISGAAWTGQYYDPWDDLTFDTPCPEPAGGWRIVDESKASEEDMFAAFERATQLEGYATAWMDQSLNPNRGAEPPEGLSEEEMIAWEMGANDPATTIANVKVTGDPAVAEAALREVWSGMLCVTTAERTEAEVLAIQDEIMNGTPGSLGGGAGIDGVIRMDVIYDDGSLQRQFDETYGEGVVRVTSQLVPVE